MHYKVPAKPEKGWKRPPCDGEMAEYAINGACWTETSKTPPCGRLYEHEGKCYRPMLAPPRRDSSIEP